MDLSRVYDILNELLAAEQSSLLPRLAECSAFVPRDEAAGAQSVEQMVADQRACVSRLVETLRDLGGEPRPFVRDIASARFHYVELETLLPHVLAGEESLAAKYHAVLEELSGCRPAASVAADIGTRHQVWAECLRQGIGHAAWPH